MTLELSYIAATSRLDRLDPTERSLLRVIALGQSGADTDALVAARLGITLQEATALSTALFDELGLRPTPYLGRHTLAKLALRHAGRKKISEVGVSAGGGRSSSFRETER
ncbi:MULTISPECIES: hypothetical protein [unclassified Nocardioides]|uniref:hypothetical protein n=1 Tax=unclassified Nocardioides TaxID=2615069 RepID=UPI0006F34718|nr:MULTISPECIES: hypothetical protein [unclassified Nocardioides]KRA27854.1 hypothetical protein ASD81_24170 [Nocardioides sp. Root614]KRA86683.1 hypothetical protein ASD84_20950 [Nocardioides sp. Root682]